MWLNTWKNKKTGNYIRNVEFEETSGEVLYNFCEDPIIEPFSISDDVLEDEYEIVNIGAIAREIGDFCVRWARMNVRDTKEKFNCVRVYCGFGFHNLHSIIYPRYCFSQFPKWLWSFDCKYISKFFELIKLNRIVVPWQIFIYKLAYNRAVKKYPQLKYQILIDADYLELIDKEFHDEHWSSV
jgi:hypothetical protein